MNLPYLPMEHEIQDVFDWCAKAEMLGLSDRPELTYEQGVAAGMAWLLCEPGSSRPDLD